MGQKGISMFKSFTAVLILVMAAFTLIAYQNCGSRIPQATSSSGGISAGSDQTVTLTGKVTQENLDGCNFLFYGDNNQPYQVLNLSSDLKVDGKRLQIEAVPRDDMVSTCMKGSIVEAVKAEEIQ